MGALLRKIKGKGAGMEDSAVPFDPLLWSKEGCNNRRYMLPGIACSVSRPHRTAPPRTAPHRTAPHRTAPRRTAPRRTAARLPAPPALPALPALYLPSTCPPACVSAGARRVLAP